MEKINHFIWDYLGPLAKEASVRKKDRRYRGLEFVESRLQFTEYIKSVEQDITYIMQAVKGGEAEDKSVRESLLNRHTAVITRMKSFESYLRM